MELNQLWGTTYASFDAIPTRQPKTAAACQPAEWYDWCAFNNYRVTDWFRFEHDIILASSPDAKCHLKIMNEWQFEPALVENEWQTHAMGIDREKLIELFEINGCDTNIGPTEPTSLLRV